MQTSFLASPTPPAASRADPTPPRERRGRLSDRRALGLDARAPGVQALLHTTLALVLAGGRGSRLRELTALRAKPDMPFAGKLKIIDFALGNCLNSGIRRIAVLTQYRAQSLIRHVTRGFARLDSAPGEFIDVVPAQQKTGECWYVGTADAVYQNLDLLAETQARYVLVLAGDHVYKMDYSRMLAEHVQREADVSVACIEVPLEEASAFGVMAVDDCGRVQAFAEKPARPTPTPGRSDVALASMGVYIFNADFLARELVRDACDITSHHDFGGDLLPHWVRSGATVFAHSFGDSCVNLAGGEPYWRDVGTLDAYWDANIDLTRPVPQLNLYDSAWPIRTLAHQLPPAKFVFDDDGRRGTAVDTLVSGGCIVSGATVRRSVLFNESRVDDGSVVEDSLLLPGARVGRHCVLRKVIVDEDCVIPDGLQVGVHPAIDAARFTVSEGGVVLVTQAMLGAGPAAR